MNGKTGNSDDDRLFEKIKTDAINEKWVYTQLEFEKDTREFRDAIRKAFQLGDVIDTRIHVNTDHKSIKVDDRFYAYLNPFDDVKKAYYSTLRHKLK